MDENESAVNYGRGWKSYFTSAPNELFEEQCTLTPTQMAVYLYLLCCVNVKKNGDCVAWPSYTTIGKHTRMTGRTAQDAVKTLIEKLYIFKKNRYAEGGTQNKISNMYLINHPSVSKDFRV